MAAEVRAVKDEGPTRGKRGSIWFWERKQKEEIWKSDIKRRRHTCFSEPQRKTSW